MALITRLATAFDNPNLNTLPLDPLLPVNNLGAVRFFDPGNTLTNPDPYSSSTIAIGDYKEAISGASYNTSGITYDASLQSVDQHSKVESNQSPIWTPENQDHNFLVMLWVYNGKYPDPSSVWSAPTILRKGPGDLNSPTQGNIWLYNANINQPTSREISEWWHPNTDRYNCTNISSSGVITIDSSTYGEAINGAIWRGMGIQYIYDDALNNNQGGPGLWYSLETQVNGTTSTSDFRHGIFGRVTHVPGDSFNGSTLAVNQFVMEVRAINGDDTSWTTLTSTNVATDGTNPYVSGYFTAEATDRSNDPYELIKGSGNTSVSTPHEQVALVAFNWQKNAVQPNSGNNLTNYTQVWQHRSRSRTELANAGWTSFVNNPSFGAGNKGICSTYHQNSTTSTPTGAAAFYDLNIAPLGSTRPWHYWRFYIEDLTLSGRNAEDVYNLEWNLNSARIIQAASQIPKGDPSP